MKDETFANFGYTPLNRIIARDEQNVSSRVVYSVMQPLIEALIDARDMREYIGSRRLSPSNVLVSDRGHKVILLDVNGRDPYLVKRYGELLLKVYNHSRLRDERIQTLAQDCIDGTVGTLEVAHLRVERMANKSLYWIILIVIGICLAIMWMIVF